MNSHTPIILQYNSISSIQNLGGIAVYPNEFNRALSELDLETELSSAMSNGRNLLEKYHSKNLEAMWRVVLGGIRRISDSPLSFFATVGYFLIQRYLSFIFKRHKASRSSVVYHHMNNFVLPDFATIRIARKHNIFMITTVVDLLEVDYPEFLPPSTKIFRRHLKHFLKTSTFYFIPITNFIKVDSINSNLITRRSRHKVIKWGTDHLVSSPIRSQSSPLTAKKYHELNLPSQFFLFPAKAWAHKGHLDFLKAYINSPADFKVVFIGDLGPIEKEMKELVLQLGTKRANNFQIIGYVDDEIREKMMQNCRAVILPSCYEGFGFPYFEATFLKKAFVAFETKSYLEFFGGVKNSITVVNRDFVAFVESLINFDENLANVETQRKLTLIQELTWKSCLDNTLEVYKEVLQEAL